MQAWLVYNKEDYSKNTCFANSLIAYAKEKNLAMQVVLREDITLGIENNVLTIEYGNQKCRPELVINRSRDAFLARHLELMDIRVYNSYEITYLCNHKALTHQAVSRLGIPSVNSLFCNKDYFKPDEIHLKYPVILKSVSGHGGHEVFKCDNKEEVITQLIHIKEKEFLLQEICDNPGIDVRVFVIGRQIIGAIKRESHVDFRSNYSLGGNASVYELTEKNIKLVERILDALKCDFVGIDFMMNQAGNFIFNEIEDVVGSRTLYAHTTIDAAKCYIEYIASTLKRY